MLDRKRIKGFIAILILFLLPLSPAFAAERRNVILITFDALGAKYLPSYGSNKDIAPNLNAFSGECFVFTNAISQSGSTSISMGSLFSSRYPFTDNLMADTVHVRKNRFFLPDFLKTMGYNTYAIVRDPYVKSGFGLSQGFDFFDEDFHQDSAIAEKTFGSAISLTKTLKEPFFLWIHSEEPHSPYLPPENYFKEFYPDNAFPTIYSLINPSLGRPYDVELEDYTEFNRHLLRVSKNSDRYQIYGRSMELGDEEVKQLKARYLGNIKYADEHFGKFLRHIKSQSFFDRTIMVVSSDHGESLGAHNLFDHNDLFQDIIHVPLFLHLPGMNSMKIIDRPVELVDLYPTLLELLGLRTEYKMRGENLFKEKREKTFQFSEYLWKKVMIRGKIKYVCEEDLSYSYHLDQDPEESKKLVHLHGGMEICRLPPLSDGSFWASSELTKGQPSKRNKESSLNPRLYKSLHIGSPELMKFQMADFLALKDKGVYVLWKGKEHLKIEVTENIPSDMARQMMSTELLQIKSVFAKSFSPYPEPLSREIECPKELSPIYFQGEVDGERGPYLLLYANERFGIGVCSKDLVSFRHLQGWIYCPREKELYRIKYFIPLGERDEGVIAFFTGLTCQQ